MSGRIAISWPKDYRAKAVFCSPRRKILCTSAIFFIFARIPIEDHPAMKKILLTFLSLLGLCHAPSATAQTAAPTASSSPHVVTIAVMGINDFHAGLVADPRQGVPGAAYVVQTVDSLKSVYPHHLVVSVGDNFGGSFFYSATRGASLLPQFFKDLDLRISAVGNHEFDDGQEALADKWRHSELLPRNWDLTYVCANCRNAQGAIPDFAQPWVVAPIQVGQRRIDVALVGLLTSNTPWQASARRLAGLSFDGRYNAVLDSIAHLPGFEAVQKAPIRLILAHIGTNMRDGKPTWDDRDAANLQAMARRDYHGFFSAHSHSRVVGMSDMQAPMPIVQGLWHGLYVAMMKCRIDTLSGQLLDVTPELVRVNPRAQLGPKAARLQAQIEEQYQTTLFRGRPLNLALTHCPDGIDHNRKANTRQTRMGQLVCESYADAYRKAAGSKAEPLVVGVSHFGSIRAGFPAGDVTILDVGEALPFANPLRAYRYTGRQLRQLMDHGINVCTLGRIQTSGIEVEQDGKGRVKRLWINLPSGRKAIADKTPLILVADEYMTTGGDGYLPAQFPAAQEVKIPMASSTDAFITYLQSLPNI